MKEAVADLFSFIGKADAICITTNGSTKMNGAAVMGRGCAKEAKERFKGIDHILGSSLRKNGNSVQVLMKSENTAIVSFPVKPGDVRSHYQVNKCSIRAEGYYITPGWSMKADQRIIEHSAKELKELADKNNWQTVVLPRPGCGNGRFKWEDVKPLLKDLDDRFIVVHKENDQ